MDGDLTYIDNLISIVREELRELNKQASVYRSQRDKAVELLGSILVHLLECKRHGKYEWLANDIRAIRLILQELEEEK